MANRPKITDLALASKAALWKDLGSQIDELTAQRAAVRDEIIGELDHRGATAVDAVGIRIAKAQQTQIAYDLAAAADVLGRTRFYRVTTRELDRARLMAEVDAGKITDGELAKFSSKTPKGAAYPRLSKAA